jgi:phthalate 4,5-cis-dihydrodiol dehydrogenase
MREVIESGEIGPLRAINGWNFSDWYYRPRHADELDPAKGGGVALRQGSHHVDMVRYLAGGLGVSVRATTGDWDPNRPGEGSYQAFLEFASGEVATLAYSGYDHFSTTELTFDIGEGGNEASADHGRARSELARLGPDGERKAKADAGSRQRELLAVGRHHPFFGLLVVSCTDGDMRVAPNGIRIYGNDEIRDIDLSHEPRGRTAMLDELVAVVRGESEPVHDGAWGRSNLEVCLAITESSRTRSTVMLSRQSRLRGA